MKFFDCDNVINNLFKTLTKGKGGIVFFKKSAATLMATPKATTAINALTMNNIIIDNVLSLRYQRDIVPYKIFSLGSLLLAFL